MSEHTHAERWREYPGDERYWVSDQGRVWSYISGKVLSPGSLPTGHLMVTLASCGERARLQRYVHHLVLETYVGPRPDGKCACHWNDVPGDNRLDNLRWASPADNAADARRNGRVRGTYATHCKRGHEFTPENTIRQAGRGRLCRTCWNAYQRDYQRKRRAEKARIAQ